MVLLEAANIAFLQGVNNMKICADRFKEHESQRPSSPSDVGHLLLLADIDLEVVVPLVDTHNLVLINLVACSTEQLAPLLDALQGI